MKKPGERRKSLGGRQQRQLEWHIRLRSMGYAVCTCYSWQAAIAVLLMYHSGAPIMNGAGQDGLLVDDETMAHWPCLPVVG